MERAEETRIISLHEQIVEQGPDRGTERSRPKQNPRVLISILPLPTSPPTLSLSLSPDELGYQSCLKLNFILSLLFFIIFLPSHFIPRRTRGFHEEWASEREPQAIYKVEHLVALRRRDTRLESIARTRGDENPTAKGRGNGVHAQGEQQALKPYQKNQA